MASATPLLAIDRGMRCPGQLLFAIVCLASCLVIQEIEGLSGLSLGDARAVEQTLIDTYRLGKNGGSLLNKINSISPTANTPYYLDSLFRGQELLKAAGHP